MHKRAQLEIFGLVLIVILITIGLLFAIFIMTKPKSSEIQRVKESTMAANFLNTVLGTTASGCGKKTVRDLLKDCASVQDWNDSPACSNNLNSCEFAQSIIHTMLQNTLGTWGKTYNFFIKGSSSVEKLSISNGPCTGEREGFSRPEKVRGSDIIISLWICR